MANFLNLNEEGALTQSGRTTNTLAEEHDAQSRTHMDQVESTAPELQGRGGTAFRNAGALAGTNERALAEQFVAEAMDVAGAETEIMGADESAATANDAAVTGFDAQTFQLNRTI